MPEEPSTPDRIGVFGSAFNPPQNAHLSLVGAAIAQLALDRVVVVPTGDAYHKDPGMDPGPDLRLKMAQAAFGSLEEVLVSPCEVEREGPSYTYVTLEEIEADNPDSEIHLLMSADTARGFGGWKRPERILELARIDVAPRPGGGHDGDREEVMEVFRRLAAADRVDFLDLPEADLSSSLVRDRIAAGDSITGLVPAAVAQMIDNEGVYGSEQ